MKQYLLIFTLLFAISCGGPKKSDESSPEPVPEEQASEEVDVEESNEADEATDDEADEATEEAAEAVTGPKTTAKKAGEWTGSIVDVSNFIAGKTDALSRESAIEMVKANKMIGFYSDGTMYLVFGPNGALAYRDMAKAAGKEVTIKGKLKNTGGMNYIIADIIE